MSVARALLARYDRQSAVALGLLAALYLAVGTIWNRHIDLSRGMDWLLAGIWLFMTATLCWNIDPRRDLARVVAGFAGGLCIEAWGTWSELWRYWTDERPPLWILPAWPVAALAIDRIALALRTVVPRAPWRALRWTLLPAFVAWMLRFAWPSADHGATVAAGVAMVVVVLWPGDDREDVTLFVGGALLGVLLEYWGTSRRCWTYYTGEVPPPEAVVAHGFASVAFQRAAAGLDRLGARWRSSGPPEVAGAADAADLAG